MTRALYRAVLRLAPRHVRDGYGDDMTETFDALFDDAARRGRRAVCRLLADEIRGVVMAHWTDRRTDMTGMNEMLRGALGASRFRQAVRSLFRRRSFAAASLLTLAVGTGATTAVYAVVDTVLLKPLPYPAADRLVALQEAMPARGDRASLIAPARLEDWQRMNTTFDAIAGTYVESVTDTSGEEPERYDSRRVTPRYFAVMGALPTIGRTFTPTEEQFGGPMAAVISDGLWARRYQRAASALGAHMTIGGQPVTVVGVMPPSFAAASVDLWLPAQLPPALLQIREARFLSGVGRMRAGVTLDRARADLLQVQQRLGTQYPASDKDWSVTVDDLRHARVGTSARTLWLVFAAIVLLWLIGLANLAGLMLVQLHRRGRELAIRTAIGASRAHVIGVVAHEVLLIAVVGGAAGTLLASWLLRLVPLTFTSLPRLTELHLDWHAVAAAIGSTAAAALVVGLWPVAAATRGRSVELLAPGGRGNTARRHALQRGLVVSQVALSLLLVGSAALLVRSYYNLVTVDAGFKTDGVWTFNVGARWDEDRQRVGQFQEQLLNDLSHEPGVAAAGLTNFLPMSRATLRAQVRVDGLTGPERDGTMAAGTRVIGAGYLRALQVPMISGTPCPDFRADFGAPRNVLLNERFVSLFAAGQDVVGRHLTVAGDPGTPYTVAGVVGNIGEDDTRGQASPYIYTCDSAGSWPDPEYVVRTSDPRALPAALRAIVRRHAPSRAISGLRPLEAVTGELRATPRLNAGMLAIFASAALLLASIGLYSLFMLLVGERMREIGVRLALGATPAQVVSLIWAGAGRLLMAGLGAGLVLVFFANRLIQSELFGVSPNDPLMLGGAALLLAAVSAIAIAIPASRAGRVDPMITMKAD